MMLIQLFGCLGFAMLSEILGRRAGDELQVAQASCDQAVVGGFADEYGGVYALVGEVNAAIAELGIDDEIRIPIDELAECGYDDLPPKAHGQMDPESTMRCGGRAAQGVFSDLDIRQNLLALFEKSRTLVGQTDRARGAVQELNTELDLKPRDGFTDGRGGESEAMSGHRKAFCLCYARKNTKCIEVFHA